MNYFIIVSKDFDFRFQSTYFLDHLLLTASNVTVFYFLLTVFYMAIGLMLLIL